MSVLPNPRHERFCQALIKGKTLDEAYVDAGYNPSRKNAQRLRTNEGVTRRLAQLQERAAERAEITASDILKQLDEDRALAHEVKQPGAAVSASMGQAKLFGLIKERHEHTGANGGPIKFDLSSLSDEQIAQLETIFGAIAGVAHDRGHSGGAASKGGAS